MRRPPPVTTSPPATTGAVVAGLAALHGWFRPAGTCRAGVGLGAGTAAGRLVVARASLVHQINAATAATTAAMAAAARRSPLVRRSGLTMRRRGLLVALRAGGRRRGGLPVGGLAAPTATPGGAGVARGRAGRCFRGGLAVGARGPVARGMPGDGLAATSAPAGAGAPRRLVRLLLRPLGV